MQHVFTLEKNFNDFFGLNKDQADKEVVSVSDTTLISTVGSNTAGELVDYGQNEASLHNGHRPLGSHRNDHFYPRESPNKRANNIDNRGIDFGREIDPTSPYKFDYQGSPLPFSDASTDGESGVSDTFKNLLKRDYLSMRNGYSFSAHSTPSRIIRPFSVSNENNDVPYTCAIDLNLDYTIHVGKLAIYVKQIRFNINRVEEFVIDNFRVRGKIKCCLLNPAKGQRNTSNVFEATRRNKKIVYVDLDECFVFYLFPKTEIPLMSLSFKVHVSKKLFREYSLGESVIRLGDFDLNAEMLPMTITFGETLTEEKRTRSLQPVVLPKSEKLEILLSLEYNADTAKLIVNVDQTTKLDELRYESKREIIFQAELVSPSCECVQRKTTFLRISEDNPGSNKPFQFDLPQEDLLLNTLMLSVSYSATRWLQQEKIGWIAFGRNCSGQVEAEHWDLMISQSLLNEPAVQWHCLCECPDVNKSHTLLTRVFK
ncbi:synaptotagmin-14-like [Hydractinia symbiolongicarpus]|uniref:synaptotagmin-14-like n=1 Tax=Hydractinia symbiolongicarpus TaxID=13093 RepID=UPI00254F75E9|nr:synaptotagmin-14-like [Hydractinia symbiolongicarpus]